MKIVLDMQGAQTESRLRGIGRYTLAFARAVVDERGDHDVHLVLNGLLEDSIKPLREMFAPVLPEQNIHVWIAPGPVMPLQTKNLGRLQSAEMLREAFIAALEPDIVHITSLFEGYADESVISVGRFDQMTPVTVTLYDLIPYLHRDQYLKPNPPFESYYLTKLDYLRQCALSLSISTFSKSEAQQLLDLEDHQIVNKSSAVDAIFRPLDLSDAERSELLETHSIDRRFILYTGGSDTRKNLTRLLKAYKALPESLREETQLVFAGKMTLEFLREASSPEFADLSIVFTGYISDDDLVGLYNLCDCFVFPSWHEGFGLPVLEAMNCGAVVVASNAASVPEVLGFEEALFDPFSITEMMQKMSLALSDIGFRERFKAYAVEQSQRFSWSKTARAAIVAWEHLSEDIGQPSERQRNIDYTGRLISTLQDYGLLPDSDEQLFALAESIYHNMESGLSSNERPVLVS